MRKILLCALLSSVALPCLGKPVTFAFTIGDATQTDIITLGPSRFTTQTRAIGEVTGSFTFDFSNARRTEVLPTATSYRNLQGCSALRTPDVCAMELGTDAPVVTAATVTSVQGTFSLPTTGSATTYAQTTLSLQDDRAALAASHGTHSMDFDERMRFEMSASGTGFSQDNFYQQVLSGTVYVTFSDARWSYALRRFVPGVSGQMLDISGRVTALRDITPIPEPGMYLQLAFGIGVLCCMVRTGKSAAN